MDAFFSAIARELIFWMAWIIIPLVMEIVPAIGGFFLLLKKSLAQKEDDELDPETLPDLTLIIPVYNSEQTLRTCLESVYLSDYPKHLLHVLLVNNQSADDSFRIFNECQKEFSNLPMTWLNSKQGKSKALNMALFNSQDKYVINIDSDGILHPQALKNMVKRFEQNPDITTLTGSVLTNIIMVEDEGNLGIKLLRRCEFFEYCQAFLAGRNFASETNSIYTLSGAFSAFRKSTILKTQLYNMATVCEDTHVTFQVRHLLNQKVHLCENALFFVDPIESWNKLYTQRQRWQRGEIEVSHMFLKGELQPTSGFFSNFMVRLLMYDHTFAFPRMIWYFALIYLVLLNYPIYLVIGSVFIIYLLYAFTSFLYYINIRMYLNQFKDIRKYYAGKWYLVFLLPLFNFAVFWMRLAGIINSIKSEGRWKTTNLAEEIKTIKNIVDKDTEKSKKRLTKISRIFNINK